jgi:hypothetical protein
MTFEVGGGFISERKGLVKVREKELQSTLITAI